MRNLVRIFKALSDPNRVRILKMLEVKPLCVCEITAILKLANSTVSRHLAILREAELILDQKDKKWVNYRLNSGREAQYISEILPLLGQWLEESETVKADRAQVEDIDRNLICGN